ncbi:MAG: tyrosine protein phosphatase yvh1 [Geoglossum umbratile]|nr:MAG: tyrosine protein phosphatase yvh1 [Geoglossum umbratile]
MAYLIQKYHVTPQVALEQLQRSRPICEPNPGFMQQLELYHQWQAPVDLESEPAYQRWLYRREAELSTACGKAPDKIRFEDEQSPALPDGGDAAAGIELRCRKCRQVFWSFGEEITRQSIDKPKDIPPDNQATSAQPCSHHFLDPLSWMKAELEQGKLEGRLECPKCGANVGKYAWQGMRCSCSEWVVPGISLARGKVDEVRSRMIALAHGLQPQQQQEQQQQQQQQQQQRGANVTSGGPDFSQAVPRAEHL